MNTTRRVALTSLFLFTILLNTGCWVTSDPGTVTIETVYGNITQIIRPESGGDWTIFTFGGDWYTITMRPSTKTVPVASASNDNARFKWSVTYSAKPINTDESITNYFNKFGLNEEERHTRRDAILDSQASDITGRVMSGYSAYDLLERKEEIRAKVEEVLKPVFAAQALMELESIQISGNPDFDDDRIDNAAGAVVAASKEKEAENERLLAAEAAKKRKEVEATTAAIQIADPKVYALKQQEIALQIEQARADGIAKHQGTLTIIYGGGERQNTQIQIPANK